MTVAVEILSIFYSIIRQNCSKTVEIFHVKFLFFSGRDGFSPKVQIHLCFDVPETFRFRYLFRKAHW